MVPRKLAIIILSAVIMLTSASCASLTRPVTHREQTAGVGLVVGAAGGALIGSLIGGAVAGGLVGAPLGAVAGFYIGDRMAREDGSAQAERLAKARVVETEVEMRRRLEEKESEINKLLTDKESEIGKRLVERESEIDKLRRENERLPNLVEYLRS